MSEETAVAEFSDDTKVMGDKIAEMTLKQAKELSDYLKDVHGIEPAVPDLLFQLTSVIN